MRFRLNASCSSGLFLLAVLAACGRSEPRQTHVRGTPVLRAIYRDGTHHLLVALADGSRGLPPGDCAAPLLIDDATGGAQQISRSNAADWMKRMQLSGAIHGTCP